VTSGIPSIIFGLAGALIFIPFINGITGHTGGSIFSGSLTLAIMLLPTIVKTVEESIKVVPASLSQASLALGASKVQTIFKVTLPNSLPGILSATLLSIGRIIGESAALIFSMGAVIGDNVSLLDGQASLAVHIWTCLQGESPQYGSACAISIIILAVVLLLSLLIKLLSYQLEKKKGKR
ncbi:MAG TPA: phosphate ABC transporter, permease protein PstA, partial [Firmicutes bacterium]|nr:phosphate ABC transporter, permease protein PstA [Bacillota bacterium]